MSLIQKSNKDVLLIYTKTGAVFGINKSDGHEQFRVKLPPLTQVKSSRMTSYFYDIDKDGQLYYGVDDYSEKLPLNMKNLAAVQPTKSGQILITGKVENHFVVIKNGKLEPVNSAQCIEGGIVIGVSTYSVKLIHLNEDITWDLQYTKLHGHDRLLSSDLLIKGSNIYHDKWSFEFDDEVVGFFDSTDNNISHYQQSEPAEKPKAISLSRFSKDLKIPYTYCDINSPFYPNCALVPSTEVIRVDSFAWDDAVSLLVLIAIIASFVYYYLYRPPKLHFPTFVDAKFQLNTTIEKQDFLISKEILGYGSNGTVVFKGEFNTRQVAIKRLLKDFTIVAEREVELLQSSDIHENIVRLFFLSKNDDFIYIVLELCLGNLEQFIQQKPMYEEKDCILQITNGLAFLHKNKIIHRDLKPLNILFSGDVNIIFKITDFGTARNITDATTITTDTASGTKGWQCPEQMHGKSLSDKVDIFALGCLYHYILSHGQHPFGNVVEREINIIHDKYELDLSILNENEALEAEILIKEMISLNSDTRPGCGIILHNPLYWTARQKLTFICNISNRLETEKRGKSELLQELELLTVEYDDDWSKFIHLTIFNHLNTFRVYKPHLMQDLLRSVRNLVNHFQELPSSVTNILSDDFNPNSMCVIHYFLKCFPDLVLILRDYAQENEIYDDVKP